MIKHQLKYVTSSLRILFVLIFILAAWSCSSRLINKSFLPSPSVSFKALLSLAQSGMLFFHLGASLSRIFWAFLWSFIPAAALGLTAGRSTKLNALISPILYITYPLPKAAFLPVIMLFFGLGEISKIVLISLIIFSQILIAARDSSSRIPQSLIHSVRSLGAGSIQVIQHVIIPAALPDLFTSLRVSLGTALAVLFLAETFAASSGLGFLIIDAWTRIAYAEMYASILALSILGLALFMLTDIAERLFCPWK